MTSIPINIAFRKFVPQFIQQTSLYKKTPQLISHTLLTGHVALVTTGAIYGAVIGSQIGYEMGDSIATPSYHSTSTSPGNVFIRSTMIGFLSPVYGTCFGMCGAMLGFISPVVAPIGYVIDTIEKKNGWTKNNRFY